jgi:flagellin
LDTLSHIFEDSNGDLILTGSLGTNLGIIKVSQNDVQGSDEHYIELDSIVKGNTIISFDNVKLNFNDEKLQKLSGIEFEWSSNTFSEDGINNSMLLQLGANAGQIMTIAIDDMRPEALGFINGMPRVNPIEMAGVSITLTDQAIMRISSQRSTLGAYQNRLEHVIRNLDNSAENLQAAESRITDLDMAKGASEMTKFNILSQAADAMIAQANQQPQGILQLLK